MMLHLGPFQGITDVVFRNAFQQHFGGIDKLYTPFFGGIHSPNNRHFRSDELNPQLNDVKNLVPQLLTNNAAELERFALQCHQLGYTEININMGCPWPQVTSKKRGCGLMPLPGMVAEMLSVVKDLPVGVSVKCRLGMNDVSELRALIPVFEKSGISGLIVHTRTGKQLYRGKAQPEAFAPLAAGCTIPLVYNGDIFQASDIEHIQKIIPGLSGFMLGRGLLSDPFLAADIKRTAHNLKEDARAEIVRQFVETLSLQRLHGRRQVKTIPGPMKELWWYLSRSFDEPLQVWRAIRKANGIDEFMEVQSGIFRYFRWVGAGFARKLNPGENGAY